MRLSCVKKYYLLAYLLIYYRADCDRKSYYELPTGIKIGDLECL